MKRKIITIDEKKCNGCELCVKACHEGAIGMINGKATLLRDDYCDGLGDCLPVCPTGAITFEEREALAYDEVAVQANMKKEVVEKKLPCGCPSTASVTFERDKKVHSPCGCKSNEIKTFAREEGVSSKESVQALKSELRQFPVQLQLVPANAPYFNGCDLLIAADCTPFAYANFHNDFIKNRITLVGCPKLDDADYAEKLTQILTNNDINSITVVRMEVPCCGGIVESVKAAIRNSGKILPWNIVTISRDGRIL